ncbi:NUDIX hydrolase [Pelobacter propionicus]|uniref:NUDIX hydrolase n=1 Tax=Pelobacter propionicus (strain DSM 2379 / NBRC 103807 / OttBd1) TaxID=338966 RepID=A1AU24_PELPD|nr:NUDIX domain-containing protein [Pelobacter propionicus]ABL00845.1 NUDIX hydrolase [Pelobacter propionicus DSM 2379]
MTVEWFDIVDENGTALDRATRARCHDGSKLLHPVVHVHVFNSGGKLLLQKRKLTKDIQPGKWDTSVGGHIQSGELLEDAIQREVLEEIGIEIDPARLRPLGRYLFESEIEREYVYSYACTHDGPFRIQEEEIDEVRFLDITEIDDLIATGETTPNFNREADLLRKEKLLGERAGVGLP